MTSIASVNQASDNAEKIVIDDKVKAEGNESLTVVMSLSVKWNGALFPIDIYEGMTVSEFKEEIQTQTKVRPEKQKLINLKAKGKPASESMLMTGLGLKNGAKIMMVGSIDEDLVAATTVPDELPEVVNDLDIAEDKLLSVHQRQDYIEKIEKRVREYELKVLNPMRPGKKLLVLDIDYTLFDHRSVGQNGLELMRPYLHEFLLSAYQDYDIAIWSATSMKWIQEKMKLLGVSTNPNYKIVFYVDSLAMIRIEAPDYGVVEVKPLAVIWGKHRHYHAGNTVMLDDLRRNFLMNPQNGLKIRPFRRAHENRGTDRELLKLAGYLQDIAQLDDLSALRHSRWESYRPGGY
ncbi:ubiquitin-like domain-containing CTD phosphatase 1 isoform X2 [Hyalella azteca]|uniref:Ubiquitin-like domain-containing CTD phosphatase 1 n=1 Tax=Hyalella azteca TaxID=294128 RepID=A0A8B7ND80_HYAAZ|nr:ubiquitin-like domain-containing CTD phosphatase 1 isoform X1 [Hyalella azteca]XP_018011477.1 ubiquitin-like domain-containing CTD phosphatase 1 isoform X2 [Hyalella azteca]